MSAGVVAATVIAGIGVGALGVVPHSLAAHLETLAEVFLGVVLFAIGIEIGQSREAWRAIRRLGVRALLVPAGVAVGSLGGAGVAGWVLHLPLRHAGAIGAGFGWYSLSGIMLTRLVNLETGALAFLSNVAREFLAILVTPLVARSFGRAVAIAPGGATTMDVTLAVVVRAAGPEVALVAFINGVVLSSLVPIMVTILGAR
ncbi:MAG TPA: lysine exporter LysO family protein [bacterium]|nr:lysine exporter LysO family protein [bacterium]